MKIAHKPPYTTARANAYPPLAELADALVAQASGDPKPFKDYVAKCQAVKAKYPKPSGGAK